MTEYFPTDFVSGAITAGYLVLGLFFLRFWRRTRDALFANFAAAFWLLAVNQGAATLTRAGEIETSWIYLIRLAAFLIIIAAIARKNFGTPPRS
jgi:membrane-associated PAP2 superfamily phosphatase